MTKVMITVRGGVIQSVTSSEEIEYMVVDHDNIEAGADVPTMDDFISEDFIRDEISIENYLMDTELAMKQKNG